jgi:hypothetical protein
MGVKTCPSATVLTTTASRTAFGSNPGFRGEKPATDFRRYHVRWMCGMFALTPCCVCPPQMCRRSCLLCRGAGSLLLCCVTDGNVTGRCWQLSSCKLTGTITCSFICLSPFCSIWLHLDSIFCKFEFRYTLLNSVDVYFNPLPPLAGFCTTRFNIRKNSTLCPQSVFVFLYESQNKHQSCPYTTLTDSVWNTEGHVYDAERYEYLNILGVTFRLWMPHHGSSS